MGLLLVIGCSKKPETIVNDIYEGANKNDVSKILPYVVPDSVEPFTDEEKKAFATYLLETLGSEPYKSFKVDFLERTDTATRIKFIVDIQFPDGQAIKEGGTLIKTQKGNWKLGLFNPPGEYELLFTIEDPLANNHELMRSIQFAYIKTMAQRGIPEYLGMEAVFYKDGVLVEKDLDRYIELSINAARQGSSEALFQMGDLYFNGLKKKIQKDDTKAFEYMLKAAEAGHVAAMNNVGYFYENGIGTVPDAQKAIEWYHKSAYEGNFDAACNLANMLATGNGIERDYYAAFGIYKAAAEAGNAKAMESLSQLYQSGHGTDINYEQMLYWAQKAAENNLISAMNHMGDIYYQGIGVEKDYNKSFYWYKKSADQKDLYGQYMVGQAYQYGRGVEMDLNQALNWYRDGSLSNYQPSVQASRIIYDSKY